MQPCIVCGKTMKKKDSVMLSKYVCSIECKEKRKLSLPKKLSATSWKYWVKQGLSEKQAKEYVSTIQAERSPRSINYWVKKGYSRQEAAQKVSDYQQTCGLRNLEKYTRDERQERSPFSIKYWEKKGYNIEQAKKILKENADSTSLSFYIKKYGLTFGQELYTKMCQARKKDYTLEGYQKKYGEVEGKQLWSKKYKNRHNSKKACDFFNKLSEKINSKYKIYTASNENGEYGILNKDHNKYFFYDFVVPELKLCVEYHGDYWHCNPKKYDSLYEHKQSGALAKDIWAWDKVKQDTITSDRGFEVITVWESDDQQEKINFIMEKISEFEKSKNC